ncbi:MAG: DNA polymerase III subunit beta [Neomegalonema sp.]|nr:DNA polymerase III subunit beta [Neomegalonema sp.]
MQVLVERSALLKSTSRTQGIVERRNTIPILSNLLINAADGALSIKATDLDIEIIDAIPANVAEPGAVTVSAHMLHEIVRKLPEGAEVSLTADGDGAITVSAGRSRFALATLPKDEFPVMATAEFETSFEAPCAVIRRLFDKAKFAISTEETRYYLNGVYFHLADQEGATHLRAVATDGHRLARVDAEMPDGASGMANVIVPRKTVGELRKLLENDNDIVTISVSETKIRFACNGVTLTSKVIDGTFPDYTRVIPTANTLALTVEADRFASAVDRVSTVSSERTRAVKMSLGPDKVTLSVNSPDSGSATEEIEVDYGGDEIEIGFNSRYLLDIAQQIDGEQAVFLFSDPGSPTLVRENDDASAIYVVMPMRV